MAVEAETHRRPAPLLGAERCKSRDTTAGGGAVGSAGLGLAAPHPQTCAVAARAALRERHLRSSHGDASSHADTRWTMAHTSASMCGAEQGAPAQLSSVVSSCGVAPSPSATFTKAGTTSAAAPRLASTVRSTSAASMEEAVEAVEAQEEVKAGAVKAVASGWGPRGPRVDERAQS